MSAHTGTHTGTKSYPSTIERKAARSSAAGSRHDSPVMGEAGGGRRAPRPRSRRWCPRAQAARWLRRARRRRHSRRAHPVCRRPAARWRCAPARLGGAGTGTRTGTRTHARGSQSFPIPAIGAVACGTHRLNCGVASTPHHHHPRADTRSAMRARQPWRPLPTIAQLEASKLLPLTVQYWGGDGCTGPAAQGLGC